METCTLQDKPKWAVVFQGIKKKILGPCYRLKQYSEEEKEAKFPSYLPTPK